jgi:hypothetical protein
MAKTRRRRTAHHLTKHQRRSRAARKAARTRRRMSRVRLSNPRRHHAVTRYRRRIRNPRMPSAASIKGMVIPAVVGGVGAVGLDYLWGYTAPYLPASLQAGYIGTVAKSAVAIGGGWLAGKVIGRQAAAAGVVGALTVIAYQTIHQLIAGTLTAPTVSAAAAAPAATPGMSAYMPRRGQMGWVSPGSTLRGLHGARFGAYAPGIRAPQPGSSRLVNTPGGGVAPSGLAYAGGSY